jgi:hypothetical protein
MDGAMPQLLNEPNRGVAADTDADERAPSVDGGGWCHERHPRMERRQLTRIADRSTRGLAAWSPRFPEVEILDPACGA